MEGLDHVEDPVDLNSSLELLLNHRYSLSDENLNHFHFAMYILGLMRLRYNLVNLRSLSKLDKSGVFSRLKAHVT